MQLSCLLILPCFVFVLFAGAGPWANAADSAKSEYPPGVEKLAGQGTPLNDGDRIVFFGDSITQAGGYHKLIAKALQEKQPRLDVEIINAGISGNKVPNLQARIEKDVLAKKPTVVFIYIGINDVWHSQRGQGTPKDKYEAGLHDIVQQLKKAGATVVLATPTTIGEKPDGSNPLDPLLEEYAAISRKVAQEENITLCDLRVAFIDYLKKHNPEHKSQGILTNDGVHMLPAGDALIADQASRSILSALADRKK